MARPRITPEQIRRARHTAGHTQTRAGQVVGVTLRSWQNWEDGTHLMPPGLWELYRLHTGQHPNLRVVTHPDLRVVTSTAYVVAVTAPNGTVRYLGKEDSWAAKDLEARRFRSAQDATNYVLSTDGQDRIPPGFIAAVVPLTGRAK